jgi:hypothetical protein
MQMKKHMTSIKKSIFAFTIFMTFLTVQPVMAQEEFEEDVDDEPAAPIDDYIIIGLIAGGFLGLTKMQRGKILQK